MKPRHQVSRAAIDLIKRFEGYRRRAVKGPDGRWTIGYSHTLTAREGAEVSESDAEALLIYDLIGVAHAVNEHTFSPLTQNEFDALISFAFSVGPEAFAELGVLRRLNEGQHLQAACAMDLWRRAEFEGARPIIDALVRRRALEKALFLTPAGPWTPAPSAILRPSLDVDLAGAVPSETPAAVEASMEGDLVLLRRDVVAFPQPEPTHPAEAAAAAVTTQLAGLFREPETAAEPDFMLTPPDDEPPEPRADLFRGPAPAPGEPQPSLFEHAPVADPEPSARPNGGKAANVVALGVRAKARGPRPSSLGLAPLGVLAILGAALFAGGLYWAFHYAPQAGLSASSSLTVGWLAGVVGVACFSVAAYRLFERLGRPDEDDILAG